VSRAKGSGRSVVVRKYKTIPLAWVAGVGVPILTFCGGTFLKVWTVVDNIATKTELTAVRDLNKADIASLHDDMVANFKRTDEAIAKSVSASKQYTDDKYLQTKEEYRQYSDSNKLKTDAAYAELKGQNSLILSVLQEIKVGFMGRRR
jgi:hypothetical protein